MPFSATVLKVLIASPSDVQEERGIIAQALHAWNAANASSRKIVLLPVMWETHAAPQMGVPGQVYINEDVAGDCDLLIGTFWSRLGSPTGAGSSGTVEEIRLFLSQKKPVMLYFSKKSGSLEDADWQQIEKLKEFKKSVRNHGFQGEYESVYELKDKLTHHLQLALNSLSLSPTIDKTAVAAAKASMQTAKLNPANRIYFFEKSSDRGFCVRGDTAGMDADLKARGGQLTTTKVGGKEWRFSNRKLDEVATFLGIEPVIRMPMP